ncbi:phosphoglycerate mutase family protein [Amycolatopsis sp. NPDC049688]|uniref:phosphoglycerate mutase family protein n=1 Tax=Amycolatopsis sp. NPDC049688 TaxID=3154733 RepID=UPI00341339A0
MRRLFVVTHPPRGGPAGRLGGWLDSALTARGHIHAMAIAARLRQPIARAAAVELYSSDLRRAVQTAEPIAHHRAA